MAKKRASAYVCNDGGADFGKWQGQCSECSAWNTLSEVRLGVTRPGAAGRAGFAGAVDGQVAKLADIALQEQARIPTGFGELDLVLGGGLVEGSCVLVGGEPGAGKSTLLLQNPVWFGGSCRRTLCYRRRIPPADCHAGATPGPAGG